MMKLQHFALCNEVGQVLWRVSLPANTEATEDQPGQTFEPPTPEEGQEVYGFEEEDWPGAPCYINEAGELTPGFSPDEPVDLARARKREQIEQDYSRALLSGFTFSDWSFQSSPESLSAIAAYVASAQSAKMLNAEMAVDFKLSDNRVVTIHRDQWLEISVALATWRNDLNTKRQALKTRASTATRAQLPNIKWN